MGTLLKVVGAIWALIGLANLIGMPWTESSEGILTFGLMLNMLLFIIPGLVVYGIGAGIKKRQATSTEVAASKSTVESSELSVEERLNKLNGLKEKGLIDEAEYESRRAEILEALDSGSMKKCPDCAELIKAEAIKCRFCGKDLPANNLEAIFREQEKFIEALKAERSKPPKDTSP